MKKIFFFHVHLAENQNEIILIIDNVGIFPLTSYEDAVFYLVASHFVFNRTYAVGFEAFYEFFQMRFFRINSGNSATRSKNVRKKKIANTFFNRLIKYKNNGKIIVSEPYAFEENGEIYSLNDSRITQSLDDELNM